MRKLFNKPAHSKLVLVLLAALLIPVVLVTTGSAKDRDSTALSARILCNRATWNGAPGGALPEIWTMDYAGANKALVKPYATNPGNAKGAVYSPSGSYMAFEGTDQNPLYMGTAIYLAGFDGSNPIQITPSMDMSRFESWTPGYPKYSELFECPTFSSDSSKIYLQATLVQRSPDGKIIYTDPQTGNPMNYISDLWKVNIDGTGWGPVRGSWETSSEAYPQGSPVDDRIAQTQMMGGMTDFSYAYSPYPPITLAVGTAGNEGIFTIDAAGGNYKKIAASHFVFNTSPNTGFMITDRITPFSCAWSPDGTKLAMSYYVSYTERTYGITGGYYFGACVIDASKTNDGQANWDWSVFGTTPQYWYGTRITPVGWPAAGPSIVECEGIGKMSWSADGRYVLFDVGKIPPGVQTVAYADIWAIDVSNLAAPGAPVNISNDRMSYWPSASPSTLGNVPPAVVVPNFPFFLSEGTTRPNFDEYLAIQNPNDAPVDVNLDYLLGGGAGASGGANKSEKITIDPTSRYTVNVRGSVGENQDVSVYASASKGVIVERPMYFNYGADKGLNWTGGHDVLGATAASKEWYFAEGTTRNNSSDGAYDEYLCIENNNEADANVTINYMLGDGGNKEQKVPVNKKSRETVSVNTFLGANVDVSCKVSADQDIVVERPMYFNYKNKWNGGHDVVGATSPEKTWYFAEGTTRNNPNDGYYDEYLCLQNPNDSDANVTITYMLGDGTNKEQKVPVKKKSRETVSVNGFIGNDQDDSCKVASDVPIVAERPIYFNTGEAWNGGHNVIGAKDAKNTWYFAEGTTRVGFTEWICLQNPGDAAANVTVTYMLGTGENKVQSLTIKPRSRHTVDVKLFLGAGQDVSARITSDVGIIAERPMYFDYVNSAGQHWNGGHDVVGYSP